VQGLIVSAALAAALIAPAPHEANPEAPRGCAHTQTAKSFRPFAAEVWRPARWKREKPKDSTVAAYRHALHCAAGPGNRAAMKRQWRRSRAAFYRHRAYKLRWGDCTASGPPRDCIHGAAETYGADETWMLRVSWCESRWNRFAVNPSGSTGFFQFMSSTWATTPYAAKSIWSEKWQSLAGAWMNVNGRSREWVCQ
jgi:soluble lytic murein transglycosylase-like protein